jgi:putative ABC transport system permease protein
MTVGGIAAISLVVAGIMIMNIMLVAISNRRSEIGLLKALGAPRTQIMGLFLTESVLLSIAGALLGFIMAFGAMELLAGLFPEYNLALAPWSPFVASGMALGTGIIFGVLPARQASMLEPALALSRR